MKNKFKKVSFFSFGYHAIQHKTQKKHEFDKHVSITISKNIFEIKILIIKNREKKSSDNKNQWPNEIGITMIKIRLSLKYE